MPDPKIDDCSCSCGSRPGDGRTAGCQDPDGCGYWEAVRVAALRNAQPPRRDVSDIAPLSPLALKMMWASNTLSKAR